MHDIATDTISALISSMIFISETESPLHLLEWTDVHDRQSLCQKIAAFTSLPLTEQLLINADDFLKGIQQMADPADEVLVEYARAYTHLFALLSTSLTDLQVIKVGKVQQHLFIAGFLKGAGCLALHTTATET
jgi:hypothetical protein